MHPRLLTTPFFTIHTFGVFLAAGYMAALWWITRAAKQQRLDPDRMMSLGLWAIIGAVVGAKLLMVLRTLPDYLSDPSQLWSISTLQSAGDFYGGFLGSLAAVAIYFARTPQLPVWVTADICGPAIALGQAIGRIGCFMAGDDYGRSTTVPWAVTFTDPDAYRIGGAPPDVREQGVVGQARRDPDRAEDEGVAEGAGGQVEGCDLSLRSSSRADGRTTRGRRRPRTPRARTPSCPRTAPRRPRAPGPTCSRGRGARRRLGHGEVQHVDAGLVELVDHEPHDAALVLGDHDAPLRPGTPTYVLAWTTTPWTLTSNVAAAVGPELTYVKVKQGDEVEVALDSVEDGTGEKWFGNLKPRDMADPLAPPAAGSPVYQTFREQSEGSKERWDREHPEETARREQEWYFTLVGPTDLR